MNNDKVHLPDALRAALGLVVAGPSLAIDAAVRDRVNTCPHRGSELPVSAYPNQGCCGGGGPTRWPCSAGKGSIAGKPTLRECLACKSKSKD